MLASLSRLEHLSELTIGCVRLNPVTFEQDQRLAPRGLQPIPSIRKLTIDYIAGEGDAVGEALCDIVAAYFPNLQKIDFAFFHTPTWSTVRIFAIFAS